MISFKFRTLCNSLEKMPCTLSNRAKCGNSHTGLEYWNRASAYWKHCFHYSRVSVIQYLSTDVLHSSILINKKSKYCRLILPFLIWPFLLTHAHTHTHTHTRTLGRTPLDKWSAGHRDLYLMFVGTTFTRERFPGARWNSNPHYQQVSGRISTP
jgi:hypothetical protein